MCLIGFVKKLWLFLSWKIIFSVVSLLVLSIAFLAVTNNKNFLCLLLNGTILRLLTVVHVQSTLGDPICDLRRLCEEQSSAFATLLPCYWFDRVAANCCFISKYFSLIGWKCHCLKLDRVLQVLGSGEGKTVFRGLRGSGNLCNIHRRNCSMRLC